MKRSQILLSALAAVLVIALFYMLLFQPARDEVAELELQIAAEQQQQVSLNQEISRLRTVRESAPEVEAELAAAEAIIPRDAALPSALRQLQVAADESGLVLQTVSTSRPTVVNDAPDGLSAIDVSVQVGGGYFQVVDFLRRFEDPAISPRGLNWVNATATIDEYPSLNVSLSGLLYATIPGPLPPDVPAAELEGDAATDEGDGTTETDDEVVIEAEDVS